MYDQRIGHNIVDAVENFHADGFMARLTQAEEEGQTEKCVCIQFETNEEIRSQIMKSRERVKRAMHTRHVLMAAECAPCNCFRAHFSCEFTSSPYTKVIQPSRTISHVTNEKCFFCVSRCDGLLILSTSLLVRRLRDFFRTLYFAFFVRVFDFGLILGATCGFYFIIAARCCTLLRIGSK